MPTILLSIEQVAAATDRSPGRIRQWIRVGLLAGGRRVKLRVHSSQGDRDLVSAEDLAAFRERCRALRHGADPIEPEQFEETPRGESQSISPARLELMRRLGLGQPRTPKAASLAE